MSRHGQVFRRVSRFGAAIAVLGLGLSLQPSLGAHAQSHSNTGTAAPVLVNLKDLPKSAGNQNPSGAPVALPFHGASAAARAKAQELALHIPITPNVQNPGPGVLSRPGTVTKGPFQQAVNFTDTTCGCLPPDGGFTVGPNNVIAEANTAFKIYDTSNHLLAGPTEFSTLFAPQTGCKPNFSDPTGEYDNATGHFILQILTYDNSFNSAICLAISKTGDPTGAWYLYAIPAPAPRDLMDQPRIAIGSDAVYLTANQFPNGAFFTAPIAIAVKKSQIESGMTATFVDQIAPSNVDTLNPARQLGTSAAPYVEPGYFISVDDFVSCPPSCTNVYLFKWTNPFSTNTFVLKGAVPITPFAQPINAPQKGGGTVVSNDARELAGYLYNGTVYGAHAISCNPGGGTVDCVQWYQVGNIDTTPTLVQQGILGSKSQYRFFPSLALDKSGDMIMGYTYTSPNDYPGLRVTGRLSSTPAGKLLGELTEVAGVTHNADAGIRWGDYETSAIAPDGCTMYHFGEYSPANSNSNIWSTGYENFKLSTCH